MDPEDGPVEIHPRDPQSWVPGAEPDSGVLVMPGVADLVVAGRQLSPALLPGK